MGAAARDNPFIDRLVLLRAATLAGLVESWRALCAERYDFASISKASSSPRWPPPPRALAASSASIKASFRERAAALFYSNKTVSRAAHVVDKNLELAAAAGAAHSVTDVPAADGPSRRRSPARRFRARFAPGRLARQAVAHRTLPGSGRAPRARTRHPAGARRPARLGPRALLQPARFDPRHPARRGRSGRR